MSLRRLGLLLALPTVVGLSLSACGTEDDAAPGPGPAAGSGTTAGAGGQGASAGKGGTGAEAGIDGEGGKAGEPGPGPGGAGGSAGDSAGGAAGDSAGGAAGDSAGGAGGDGGQPPVVLCPKLLFNFDADPGGAMGKYLKPDAPATGPVPPVQSSTVEWSSTEGVTAPGSAKLNATFGAYGEIAQISLYFTNASWTCKTKLHAKVKLVSATDLSHISGIALSISSANYTIYTAKFNSTAAFALDTWTPIELDLTNPASVPDYTDIDGLGIQLQTKSAGTTPVPTTMYVDDIWLD